MMAGRQTGSPPTCRRWRWWRRTVPMTRRRWGRRWHAPAVAMAVIDRSHRSWSREGNPRKCCGGECRDVFHLVHGRDPFGLVFLESCANQSSDNSANERCCERNDAGVVVMMVVVMVVVVGRRRSVSHRSRSAMAGDVVAHIVGDVLDRRDVSLRRRPVDMPRRCRVRGVGDGRHLSTSSVVATAVCPGSCHRRRAHDAADRERQHHLLYCLVYCRVPFIFAQAHSRAYEMVGRSTGSF